MSLGQLKEVHATLTKFMEKMQVVNRSKSEFRIFYTSMVVFHICLIHFEQSEESKPKVDLKLLLLSCLRISATIHDVELSQDKYTQVYYESVVEETNTMAFGCGQKRADVYVMYEKIKVQLRNNFLQSQTMMLNIIGYNFEFETPFDLIGQFGK